MLQQGDVFVANKKGVLERSRAVGRPMKGPWSIDDIGLLRWNKKVFVPEDEAVRQELLRAHHDDPLAGHFGPERTSELLRRKFYWKGLSEDVEEYVSTCAACQRNKPRRHRPYGELSPLPKPVGPWKEITMDFITGLPPSKFKGVLYDAILVVVDRYTKMARYLRCTKEIDAESLAVQLVEEIIRYHGVPDGIVTDRGSVFTSNYWSNICYYLKIKRKLSTAFHPQTDGQTERQNQILEAYLRAYCNDNKDNWAEMLAMAEFAYNNSQHSSTGISPFQALFGYSPSLPPMLADDVHEHDVPSARERIRKIHAARAVLDRNLAAATVSQKKHYNKKHIPIKFALKE